MGQMIRGRAFYVENPTLSEFPVGDFRTPGFGGAHRLYTIFEPFYEDDRSKLTIPKQVALDINFLFWYKLLEYKSIKKRLSLRNTSRR